MDSASSMPEEPFPWHLGVYDAHCHPTDTVSSLADVPNMKTKALVIMASRRQDQHLVDDFAHAAGWTAGQPLDGNVIPSFGWHPWFSHEIIADTKSSSGVILRKVEHYQQVITPCPYEERFLASLPEPILLSTLLRDTRAYLAKYPYALVGEIGLDRAFRIPDVELIDPQGDIEPGLTPGSRGGRKLSSYRVDMDHQRTILTAQLNLAGEMQRAVSVHGVAAHGVLYDTLAATWKGHEKKSRRESQRDKARASLAQSPKIEEILRPEPLPYPPRICLHSFSGQPDAVVRYLKPPVPTEIFFSFSSLVNFSSRSKKADETVKAIPNDRILVESDLHVAGEQMDDLMENIIRRICEIKGWSLEKGIIQLASNWDRFVFG